MLIFEVKMRIPIPQNLLNEENREILAYIKGQSAHSDVCEPFLKSVQQFDDVEIYCPDWQNYRYVIVYNEQSIIFGFVIGMSSLYLRLPETHHQDLIDQNANKASNISSNWYTFPLFRSYECEEKLDYWVREAHKYAKSKPI